MRRCLFEVEGGASGCSRSFWTLLSRMPRSSGVNHNGGSQVVKRPPAANCSESRWWKPPFCPPHEAVAPGSQGAVGASADLAERAAWLAVVFPAGKVLALGVPQPLDLALESGVDEFGQGDMDPLGPKKKTASRLSSRQSSLTLSP